MKRHKLKEIFREIDPLCQIVKNIRILADVHILREISTNLILVDYSFGVISRKIFARRICIYLPFSYNLCKNEDCAIWKYSNIYLILYKKNMLQKRCSHLNLMMIRNINDVVDTFSFTNE